MLVSAAQILIVEDDAFTALDLEMTVRELGFSNVITTGSVAGAILQSDGNVAFAFLDIDVQDGKTFIVADRLQRRGIPFAFVSASDKAELPQNLRDCTFIPKPYRTEAVSRALRTATSRAAA